jgi:hypothetical protein
MSGQCILQLKKGVQAPQQQPLGQKWALCLHKVAPAEAPRKAAAGADSNPFAAPLLHDPEPRNGTAGNPSHFASDSRPSLQRAILDSNQWPSAPEADALSS